MDIRGPGAAGGPNEIQPGRKAGASSRKDAPSRPAGGDDTVEISDEARKNAEVGRLKSLLSALPPVRTERVQAAREKIRNGGYSPKEFDKALDSMLKDEAGL